MLKDSERIYAGGGEGAWVRKLVGLTIKQRNGPHNQPPRVFKIYWFIKFQRKEY